MAVVSRPSPRTAAELQYGFEESLKLKRNFLVLMLAMVSAALMPLAASSQAAPDTAPAAERPTPVYKYEFYAGYAYTSLNQVNQSRFGLQGVSVSVARDWGKYFALTVEGAGYFKPLRGATAVNPTGNPVDANVELVLAGPVLHMDLYGRLSGFVRVLIGGAHTGGASEIPKVSFAGGFGGGMDYRLTPHLSLRASGDNILSSFVEDPNHLGYSPHRRGNPRAAFGAVYRF